MKQTWSIALAQIPCVEGEKETNLQEIEQAIEEAYAQGADILVLPEIILTGFVRKDELRTLAEPRNGKSTARLQAKLADYPLHLIYSFPELGADGCVYNTTCFMHRDATPLAYYRKIHLFAGEKKVTAPGSTFITVDVDGVRMGILVCFDIEFPEAARTLAAQGVQILFVPSANMSPYEYPHRIFTIARALENQLFVAYCNRVGTHRSFVYRGGSMIVGPQGDILLECRSEEDAREIKTIQFSLADIHKSKEVYDYLTERRPKLYQ
ncbi:carbon-nitrogen hydrolase family protein [Aneurinibacillus sp. REN35]|uniref:carbon-nitrogen hydrolase family protein n=1 Tax=Aneurinibacillus sp. REN35 TaxID=3237286 RepID=UPI003527FE1E